MRLCAKCVYYVEDNTKAYCENDHWETDIDKSKLFNPFLFDCIDYEERDKVIESFMNESVKFA